jgi:hypothetical protein
LQGQFFLGIFLEQNTYKKPQPVNTRPVWWHKALAKGNAQNFQTKKIFIPYFCRVKNQLLCTKR